MAEAEIIACEVQDSAVIARVLKRTLDEPDTDALVNAVLGAITEHNRRALVLDMGKVDFAPSVAIGALVKLVKSFKLDGRRLLLAAVQRRVYKSLMVTRVTTLLEIHESVPAALDALKAA